LLRGFHVLAKSVPEGAKFRNTPSACSGDRNFEDFASLLIIAANQEMFTSYWQQCQRKTRRHSWSWLKCKPQRIRILTHLIKSWLLLML